MDSLTKKECKRLGIEKEEFKEDNKSEHILENELILKQNSLEELIHE